MNKRSIFVCGGDTTCHLDTSDCPNNANHEPSPSGYTDWHEWAKAKNRTHKNSKCPDCGLFKIWTPRVKREADRKGNNDE